MTQSTPILFLHGLLGHGGEWAALAQHLPNPVHAPDLLGHGDAAPLKSGDVWPQYLEQIDSLLPGEKVHIAGHSMGGILALKYAAARPERVATLVLMETGIQPQPPAAQAGLSAWITHGWPDRFASRADAEQFLQDHNLNPRWIDGLGDDLAPRFDRASCVRAISQLEGDSRLPDLMALRCPTRLILAEDTLIDESDLRAMRAHPALPPPQFVAEAGHDLHLDQPQSTSEAISNAISPNRGTLTDDR